MLHKNAIERIESGRLEGKNLLKLFDVLAQEAASKDEHVMDMLIHWLEPDDEFEVGTYVPELHLVVRRVEHDIETEVNSD